MKKLCLGIICVLATIALHAGDITLLINNEGTHVPKQFKLYFSQYYNGGFNITDSVTIASLPYTNTLHVNVPEPSLCGLQVAREKNMAEFIYNPAENMVVVSDYWSLKDGSVTISNSVENEAYAALIQAKQKYDAPIEDIEMKFGGLYFFNPNFIKQLKATEDSAEAYVNSFNSLLYGIQSKYTGTYTASTLVPLSLLPARNTQRDGYEKYDTYLAYAHAHYFDKAVSAGKYPLNHYSLDDKIIIYLDRYTAKNTDGAEQGVDAIMNALKPNTELYTHAYNLLLKNFLNFKTETLARYLINKYSDGCSINLSIEDLKKLTKMQALSVGGNVPEISLPDAMGKQQSLKNYLGSNKYTIVYFWVSWCAHCQKETPKLQALYQQYKKKGLGVYAVSLDEKKEDWTTALQKYNTGWMNVCETVPIKNSTYAPAFNVTTTPKIYIVDKAGKVVAKDVYGAKLEESIQSLMK